MVFMVRILYTQTALKVICHVRFRPSRIHLAESRRVFSTFWANWIRNPHRTKRQLGAGEEPAKSPASVPAPALSVPARIRFRLRLCSKKTGSQEPELPSPARHWRLSSHRYSAAEKCENRHRSWRVILSLSEAETNTLDHIEIVMTFHQIAVN